MTRYIVHSPVKDFTGLSAGVAFADGVATVDSPPKQAAVDYFRRHGYVVEPAEGEGPKIDPEPVIPSEPAKPLTKFTKPELLEFAEQQGYDLGEAVNGTKPELLAAVQDAQKVADAARAASVQAAAATTGDGERSIGDGASHDKILDGAVGDPADGSTQNPDDGDDDASADSDSSPQS